MLYKSCSSEWSDIFIFRAENIDKEIHIHEESGRTKMTREFFTF